MRVEQRMMLRCQGVCAAVVGGVYSWVNWVGNPMHEHLSATACKPLCCMQAYVVEVCDLPV
jgi:hypothetical protein